MSGKGRNICFCRTVSSWVCAKYRTQRLYGVSFSLSELLICTLLLITFRAISDKANIWSVVMHSIMRLLWNRVALQIVFRKLEFWKISLFISTIWTKRKSLIGSFNYNDKSCYWNIFFFIIFRKQLTNLHKFRIT
jgi:hypothetical protein